MARSSTAATPTARRRAAPGTSSPSAGSPCKRLRPSGGTQMARTLLPSTPTRRASTKLLQADPASATLRAKRGTLRSSSLPYDDGVARVLGHLSRGKTNSRKQNKQFVCGNIVTVANTAGAGASSEIAMVLVGWNPLEGSTTITHPADEKPTEAPGTRGRTSANLLYTGIQSPLPRVPSLTVPAS